MKRKIFISINLPSQLKKRLERAIEKWQDLPIRWVKTENLHITLVYLGHISEEAMVEVCEKIKNLTSGKNMFDIEMENLRLAPTDEDPRMVWLEGEPNEELRLLQEDIEKTLEIFKSNKKIFRPHVTLGKIRKNKWEELEIKPEIKSRIPVTVAVESVDVMASDFQGSESEFSIIEKCFLN